MPEPTEMQEAYRAHLEAADAQGLSIAEYARDHDLSPQALYRYRRRVRGPSQFIRAQARPDTDVGFPVQVRLPNGVAVSIGLDLAVLPELLQTLRSL